ncbi:MAG: 50S ribosomal protein L23 [Microscillaceae bacterium]|nr:50S ribosomal protein L23 [Microscillaceae bacterium]
MDQTSILKRPLMTEKMTGLTDKLKGGKERYAFIVNKRANKIQIAEAVEKMYGVSVEAVNTMIYRGKVKTRYAKSKVMTGRTNSYKKAIVTLVEGDFIDFYGDL